MALTQLCYFIQLQINSEQLKTVHLAAAQPQAQLTAAQQQAQLTAAQPQAQLTAKQQKLQRMTA